MPPGFGSLALGTFPLGVPLAGPIEEQPKLVTSRKVDHVTGRYVFDADGNNVEMSDTASRVMLIIAFNVKPTRTIDPVSRATTEARVRSALKILTEGRSAVAVIRDVRVTSPAPASMRTEVVFVDLTKGGITSEPLTAVVEVSK